MSCEEFVRLLSLDSRPAVALLEHAQNCERCDSLLRADHDLRAMPRAILAPALPAELGRALAAHRAAFCNGSAWRRELIVLAACAASVGLAFGLVPRSDLHVAPWFLQVFGVLAFAVAGGVHLHVHRNRHGFGVPPWMRWAFVAFAFVGFELLATLYARELRASATGGVALPPPPHDCALLGSLVVLAVGAAVFAVGRRTVLVSPTSAGALAASVAGLSAALFLHVHCPGTRALHLQLVHVFPMFWAVLAGLFAGRRILSA